MVQVHGPTPKVGLAARRLRDPSPLATPVGAAHWRGLEITSGRAANETIRLSNREA